MPQFVVFKGSVILPDKILTNGVVVCRNGRIVHVGSEIPASFGADIEIIAGSYISPGFIDIHVHGGANSDYMDGTSHAVIASNQAHARHGTTILFPTTTTGSMDQLDAMIGACESVRNSWMPQNGAHVAGVHFYGPYFAEDKVGIHALKGRRDPVPGEYEYFLRKNIVQIATCAAELPGALDFYRFAQMSGCFITCGHSNACWSELEAAFAEGVRHVDHFWSAMSSVSSLRQRFGTPMRASMEQYVLANEEMSTEVIADGEHLSDDLLRFAYEMIGTFRLCLVTDSNRALDCPPGEYRFGPEDGGSRVISDGKTVRGVDGSLASSMCGMDHMVRTMWKATNAPLPAVIKMASLTPAKLTGISNNHGSLETGKCADVLVLSKSLEIEAVYLAGEAFSAQVQHTTAQTVRCHFQHCR